MSSWVIALRRVAWISGIASLLVLVLLIGNSLIARAADPTPPTRIENLVTRLNLDPKNKEVAEKLRQEDLYLRGRYVQHRRFATFGFFVLLGTASVFALSLKGARTLKNAAPEPNLAAPSDTWKQLPSKQQGVLTLSLLLGGVLTTVAVLSRHDTIAAYVAGANLPEAVKHATAAASSGQALSVLPPPTTSVTPVAPSGPLPSVAPGGTALQPLGGSLPTTIPPAAVVTKGPIATVKPKAGIWPRFLGAGGDGVAEKISGWNVLWKTALALPGNNSPIVVGDKVFLTGATEKERAIYAFSATDGKLTWQAKVPLFAGSAPMKQSNDAGFAPSTMTTDGERVAAAFVNADVICFTADGKPLWQRAFGPVENNYGYASSLVVADGKLIVQLDGGGSPEEGKSRLIALDFATGKTVWEVRRPVAASWATPLVLKVGEKTIIVTAANPLVIAHDAADGKMLWRAEGLGGEVAPSPVVSEGVVFAANQSSNLVAVRPNDGKVLWSSYEALLPDIASPLAAKGLVFLAAPDGTISAIDAKDGKTVWEKRLSKPAKASPLLLGNEVGVLTTDGILHLIEPGRKFKEVGSHPIGEPANATPAVVNGRMFIRGDKHLICLGAKP